MVCFNSKTSPFTSAVTFWDRSPFATAVVTFAISLTCVVRFFSNSFTVSVNSFHCPCTPGTSAWPPRIPSTPTSFATLVTSDENKFSWSTIVLTIICDSENSSLNRTVHFKSNFPFATFLITFWISILISPVCLLEIFSPVNIWSADLSCDWNNCVSLKSNFLIMIFLPTIIFLRINCMWSKSSSSFFVTNNITKIKPIKVNTVIIWRDCCCELISWKARFWSIFTITSKSEFSR